jgi:hypothetical protein
LKSFESEALPDQCSFGNQLIEYEGTANRLQRQARNPPQNDRSTVEKQDIVGHITNPKALKKRPAGRQISCETQDFHQKLPMTENKNISRVTMDDV